ncbi:MAG: hypothetical protein CL816_00810 [Coxiellaceae bacterium]|nr:hypothetical protein [Coxiellaceae bacterium]
MTIQSAYPQSPRLWKLLLISVVASFCALLPSDALIAFSHWFHASEAKAQGILSWYLLGYACGPLLYGPLSNFYGRKKALFIGLIIALLGMSLSTLSFFFHALPGFLFGRCLAGIGASAGMIIAMIIVNETNHPTEARKKFSIIVLCFSFTPALAMALGGILITHMGILSLVLLMPLIVLVVIAVALTLHETYQGDPITIDIRSLSRTYLTTLTNNRFITLALVMTAATAITYIFNGVSPLVAIHHLHLSPEQYGELAIIPSTGLFFGALTSAYLSHHVSPRRIVLAALIIAVCAASLMVVAFILHAINLITLLLPAAVMFFSAAIIIPNTSMSVLHQSDNPAIAASILNSFALFLSSILVSITGISYTISPIALPAILLVLSIIGIFSLLLNQRTTRIAI